MEEFGEVYSDEAVKYRKLAKSYDELSSSYGLTLISTLVGVAALLAAASLTYPYNTPYYPYNLITTIVSSIVLTIALILSLVIVVAALVKRVRASAALCELGVRGGCKINTSVKLGLVATAIILVSLVAFAAVIGSSPHADQHDMVGTMLLFLVVMLAAALLAIIALILEGIGMYSIGESENKTSLSVAGVLLILSIVIGITAIVSYVLAWLGFRDIAEKYRAMAESASIAGVSEYREETSY